MKKSRIAILTLLLLPLISCNHKLLFPIEKGTVFTNGTDINEYFREGKGLIFVTPKDQLQVRSVEKCRIEIISIATDSTIIVLATGNLQVGYGNLHKCYVKKGDLVAKGQIIGELYSKDMVGDNSLQVSLKKGGKNFMPNW